MNIIKVTCQNGMVLKYESRGKDISPLIHYTKAYNFNGKSCKSKEVLTCDASYCHSASIHLKDAIKKKQDEIKELEKIVLSII